MNGAYRRYQRSLPDALDEFGWQSMRAARSVPIRENEWVDDIAETQLAWDLAELASRHLSERNRIDVNTAIGGGDCYAAIGTLLETIVRARVRVPLTLAARIDDWGAPYAHHADALRLNELLTAIRSLSDRTDVNPPHDTL
ncbi:MAG: hypothetical protein WBZ37_08235 [Mycobacterium sp.]